MAQLAPTPIRYIPAEPAEPMPHRGRDWRGYVALIREVTAAGYPPPPGYGELLARFGIEADLVVSDGREGQRALAAAIISGGGDIPALHGQAVAMRLAAASELQASMFDEVRAQVLDALRAIYAKVADKYYRQLAACFDDAADKFTACARAIPPDSLPAQIINQNRKIVEAWKDAETHANQLDALVEPLSAAAELVRPLTSPSGIGSDRNPLLINLCCDVDGVHRRVAWHSWIGLPAPQPVGGLTRAQMEEKPPTAGQPLRTLGTNDQLRQYNSGKPGSSVDGVVRPARADQS